MAEKKEIKLTAKGYADIETQLAKLREEDRPRIIQAIKEARAQGDLSENADYDAAREEQAKVEGTIKELEYMLEHATIIEEACDGTVGLGSTVEIEYVGDDDSDEFKIVGSLEADILENKISDESDMGKALCGHVAGDVVTIASPGGDYEVKIIAVK